MKINLSKKQLIKELKTKTIAQLAREREVDPSTIVRLKRKFGLVNRSLSWTNKEIEILNEYYEFPENIYEFLNNRTKSSINHKASRLGLKRKFRNRKYTINHDFFKFWSHEMAYILGFFFSDGNVSSNKRCVSLHLNSKDHYILEEISEIMSSNRPISRYNDSSHLRLDSKKLAEDLIELGCVPRKSKILKFPKIKKGQLSHFLRGYFDGDGSINFNKPNTIKIYFLGTYYFLEGVRDKINLVLDIKMNPIKESGSIWRLNYYGDNARKICFWMYKNSKGLYLRRKKDSFDNHLRLRKNESN